jgi:hypothetical protein
MPPNKDLAKKLIVEIIRQSGGSIGKTKLFKTFWLAHLYYARNARGYLSDWKIVRMPKGPGIDRAEQLLEELVAEKKIVRGKEKKGPFTEINCRLIQGVGEQDLSKQAIEAIASAVRDLTGHTAATASEFSHEFSRSWNELEDGQEMNIYSDLIDDEEYEEKKEAMRELKKAYENLFDD